MDMYLVRVNELPEKSLTIERKSNATTDDDYIAISHVWGTPETVQPTQVDGAGALRFLNCFTIVDIHGVGIVQLSPGKKDILSILRRDDVCGGSWFWMDLFCIDQTENASISITEQLMAIPLIYKSSQCVKILIESPVCESWQSQAFRVISNTNGSMDEEVFGVEEMAHGRKCPHLLFCDQWFERLWTRQEGLYGSLLDIVILNPVTCRRLQLSVGYKIRWMTEGTVMAKKFVAESFLSDKLAYHGLAPSQSKKFHFESYLDFVYRHHVDINKYGGIAGPALSYSPISEAWMSGRVTTKPRDYVFAVFPGISGYKVPLNARKMRFPELLEDALSQAPIRERFNIVPKVPKGLMLETSSKESATSWMFQEPSNIGEAYDPFDGRLSEEPTRTATCGKFFFTVANSIMLEELDFSRSNMSGVKDIWITTADNLKHMVLGSPSGPCTGTTRGDAQTAQGLPHQYFIHQFAPSAAALYLPKSKLDTLAFPAGVVSFDRVGEISGEVFRNELRRFLVCLLCGTSLHTADIILDRADFRIVSTAYGKLLALIHRETVSKVRQEDFALIGTSTWYVQGFLVGLETSAGIVIVGRTVIPTSEL